MKKVVLIVVVLAILIGGAAWYLTSRYGVIDGARLTPASTVAFVTLPDIARTGERWKETALAQIGSDPAVKAFLEKPLALAEGQGGSEAGEILENLKPGRLFLAVPSVKQGLVDVLIGFQYFGSKADLDAAMSRLHAEVQKQFPVATTSTSDYEGETVTAVATGDLTLYSASHASWGFLSLDEGTLHDALDRAAGRVTDGSLAEDADYTNVLGHLPEDSEMRWFVRPSVIMTELTKIAESVGSEPNAFQTEALAKIKGVGGTLTFDGLDQRETFFALTPEETHKYPTLDHSTMALTSPATTIFFEGVQDWSMVADPAYFASLPEDAREFLEKNNVDLTKLKDWFGSDSALIVSWAPSAMIPTAIAALAIQDRSAIETTFDRISADLNLDLKTTEIQGARVFELPKMEIQLIDPAVAISDQYIFAALTTTDLTNALTVDDAAETLADSQGFSAASAAYRTPAQAFAFIDSKSLFESIYNQLRPVILFGAAMAPDISNKVDVSKLPATEDISRHLRPIVYLQRQVDDGWMIESSGPITMSEAGIVVGAAITAAVYSGMANPPAAP